MTLGERRRVATVSPSDLIDDAMLLVFILMLSQSRREVSGAVEIEHRLRQLFLVGQRQALNERALLG
jgi:hypothetical protein